MMLVWNNWEALTTTLKQMWWLFVFAIKGGVQITVQVIKNLWNSIKSAFSGIGRMIDWLKAKWDRLVAAFKSIKLPAALTPGSPTPFEIGLRGIRSEMDLLSKKSLPQMNAGMGVSQNVASAGNGGAVQITDNRRFSSGMNADSLRVALDSKVKGIADLL